MFKKDHHIFSLDNSGSILGKVLINLSSEKCSQGFLWINLNASRLWSLSKSAYTRTRPQRLVDLVRELESSVTILLVKYTIKSVNTRPECPVVAKDWLLNISMLKPLRTFRYTDASKLGWYDVTSWLTTFIFIFYFNNNFSGLVWSVCTRLQK